jgi:hypothetical protein
MMNSSLKDQAFPDENNYGISIRDYFAAAAMQGLLSRVGNDKINAHSVLAQRTYQIADAMLEAREQE